MREMHKWKDKVELSLDKTALFQGRHHSADTADRDPSISREFGEPGRPATAADERKQNEMIAERNAEF